MEPIIMFQMSWYATLVLCGVNAIQLVIILVLMLTRRD